MYCYKCGRNTGTASVCSSCGADLSDFAKAEALSVSYYNKGYYQACSHNISAAIDSLEESLKYDNSNLYARNLLGLCYFEIGELIYALQEWVISINEQPSGNPAERYLREIKDNAALQNQMDTTIRKYNQAIEYCRNDSRDLAVMQLKKVVSMNPKFLKGHQLLALLYIQNNELDKAKKELRLADRIDTANPLTMRYMKEISRKTKEQSGRKKAKEEEDLLEYRNGNETVIMPRRFRENNIGISIRYLIAGLLIGGVISYFLLTPTAVNHAKNQMQEQQIEASDTLIANSQKIDALESRIKEMEGQVDDAQTSQASVETSLTSYEALLKAYQAQVEGDVDAVIADSSDIDTSLLSQAALKSYHALYDTILTEQYTNGYNQIMSDNSSAAIIYFKRVVQIDESYKEGAAAYYLALAYEQTGDSDNAKTYFNYVIKNYPDSTWASISQSYLGGSGTAGDDSSAESGTGDNSGE